MGTIRTICDRNRTEAWAAPGDHRLVLDGVFWIARTGAPWRDLPVEFGKWGSVYRQFRRWSIAGVWDTMLEALNATGIAPSSVQMIDSTIVRAHQHASGGKRGLTNSIGRSRGGQTTKIHLRSNSIGLPIAVTLSSGETSDYKAYEPLIREPGPMPMVMMADKGYDSDAIREDLISRKVEPVIPMRRNRKAQEPIDGAIYALRNLIKRCFNKLKNSRRQSTRYDKTTESYLSFVLIASARLWCRHFVNTP